MIWRELAIGPFAVETVVLQNIHSALGSSSISVLMSSAPRRKAPHPGSWVGFTTTGSSILDRSTVERLRPTHCVGMTYCEPALADQFLGSVLVNHNWVQRIAVIKLAGLNFFGKSSGALARGDRPDIDQYFSMIYALSGKPDIKRQNKCSAFSLSQFF